MLLKNQIIHVIYKFILLEGANQESSDLNQAKFSESLFHFIIDLLDQKDNSKNSQMEISSIQAIGALIESGNIPEDFLSKKVTNNYQFLISFSFLILFFQRLFLFY